MKIEIRVDDKLAIAAMQSMPGVVERRIDARLAAGAANLARDAKANITGHAYQGDLQNAIDDTHVGPMHYRVAAKTNYAKQVEEGTGPAAGKARYFPNFDNLVDYVKRRAVRGGEKLKKSGSISRFFQEREFVNRAFQLARYISHHGTKPVRYMQRAVDKNESVIRQDVRRAVAAGIGEAFP